MDKHRGFSTELLDQLLASVNTQQDLFGQGGVLKQLTGALVERALKAELKHHIEHEEHPAGTATNRPNGSSSKMLKTEIGDVAIEVPRDRQGTFEPILLPKRKNRIYGLDEKILGLYARGMSTRDIEAQLSELYGTSISASLISEVTEAVREEIIAWQNRPIEQAYMVIWIDALVVKIRDQGVVNNKHVYLAIGLRLDGVKEVLGLWIESNEGAKFWQKVLAELANRGLKDPLIVCCDGLKGMPDAIASIFPEAIVQTCVVHQLRYCLSFVSYRDRKELIADQKAIYRAPSEQAGEEALKQLEKKWSSKYSMIAASWRRNWPQLRPMFELPEEIRRMIYTTNAIESLNYQMRKIIKTKGHFPSDEAAIKLLYLALRNVEKRWKLGPGPLWKKIYCQFVVRFGDRATQ